jgi:hypothetical protein
MPTLETWGTRFFRTRIIYFRFNSRYQMTHIRQAAFHTHSMTTKWNHLHLVLTVYNVIYLGDTCQIASESNRCMYVDFIPYIKDAALTHLDEQLFHDLRHIKLGDVLVT